MAHPRFSLYPIYPSAPWPKSYLIPPLSTLPIPLTCLVAGTCDHLLYNKEPTYPIDHLAWLRPSPTMESDSCLQTMWALQPHKTGVVLSAKTLDITPAQKLATTDHTVLEKKQSSQALPLPTIQPPIYRNAPWPNSYLIHPLSTVPVTLTCLIAYTDERPLCNQKPTSPIDYFAWFRPGSAINNNSWRRTMWALQSNKTGIGPSATTLDIEQAKRFVHADRTVSENNRHSQPISTSTIQPAITYKKAHAKLATVTKTMKQIQKTT